MSVSYQTVTVGGVEVFYREWDLATPATSLRMCVPS